MSERKCPDCDGPMKEMNVFGTEFLQCTSENCGLKETAPIVDSKPNDENILEETNSSL